MEKQVLVNESSLVNIADSLRAVLGETYTVEEIVGYEPKTYISKTKNATYFGQYTGTYGDNASVYDTITIPGAQKIKVEMGYQTENVSYDWVQVFAGTKDDYVSTIKKYGGNSSGTQRASLEFSDTDTITFYFKSDNSQSSYLGYYAEITGYLADDTPVEEPIYGKVEKTSMFTPSEMGEAVLRCKKEIKFQPITSGTTSFNYANPATRDISAYINTNNTPFYYFIVLGATSTSASGNLGVSTCLYYDGENKTMRVLGTSTPSTNNEANNIQSWLQATYENGIITFKTTGSSYVYVRQSVVFLLYEGD